METYDAHDVEGGKATAAGGDESGGGLSDGEGESDRRRRRNATDGRTDGRTDAKSNWTNVKIIDAQDASQAAKPGAKLAQAQEQFTSPEVGYCTGLKLCLHLRLAFRSITWISPLRST